MNLDLIGTVLGILGIVTGYIFYIKGKKAKEPYWSIYNANLINGYSSLIKDLRITHKRKKIANLSVSKIIFWNNGHETIDRNDIRTAIPLMIYAKDEAEILDARILETTNLANSFSITLANNKKVAYLDFDYLDYQQGVVIQVIHTGISKTSVLLGGEIKGVKNIQYKISKQASRKIFDRSDVYSWIFVFWLFIIMILFFSYEANSYGIASLLNQTTNPNLKIVLYSLLLFTTIITITFVVLDIIMFRATAKIPQKLVIFEQDDLGLEKSI